MISSIPELEQFEDMLRELRRWGITESDGGLNAHQGEKSSVRETTRPAMALGVASEPSDTTEQKKAA